MGMLPSPTDGITENGAERDHLGHPASSDRTVLDVCIGVPESVITLSDELALSTVKNRIAQGHRVGDDNELTVAEVDMGDIDSQRRQPLPF